MVFRPIPGLYRHIQAAVLLTIRNDPSFDATLPPISDETWFELLSDSRAIELENDRLEFMGDALMYATIGHLLYEQLPRGSANLYHVSGRYL